MSSGYKQMSEKEFNTIKDLQALKLTTKQVSIVTKRGYATVSAIFNADSYEAYKDKQRSYYKKPVVEEVNTEEPAKQPAKEPLIPENKWTKVPDADGKLTFEPAAEVSLRRIATQLERIADALEAAPAKKGLFR